MFQRFGMEDAVNSMQELAEEGIIEYDEDRKEGCAIREWLASNEFVQYAWCCYARTHGIDSEDDYIRMVSATTDEAAVFDWMYPNIENREYVDLGFATPGVEVFRRGDNLYVINYLRNVECIIVDTGAGDIMPRARNKAIQQVNHLYNDIGEDNIDLTLEEAKKFIGWDVKALPHMIGSICEETYVFGVSGDKIKQLCVSNEVDVADGELFYEIK